jgi:ParB family chromosome partitioning protein
MTRQNQPAVPIARNYDMDDLFEVSGPARARDLLGARSIPVDLLDPNPYQPRTTFDPAALDELATSIRAHGVLQPITMRKAGDRYQIGAGERRWQAAKLAGLAEVPCIERAMDDGQMRELALVENVLREDLSPLDLARALQQMMDVFRLSARALSERLGKNHGYVVDKLRIARDPRIAAAVADGTLGTTVALEMAELDDERARADLLMRAKQGERIKVKDVQAARDRSLSVKPTVPPSDPTPPERHDRHDERAPVEHAQPTPDGGHAFAPVSVKPTAAAPAAAPPPAAPARSPTASVSVKPTEESVAPVDPGQVNLRDLRIIQLREGRDGEPRQLDTADKATVLRILEADLAWLKDSDHRAP